MNYQDIYDSIIFRAIDLHGHALTPRKQVHGFAVHHILPASWWQGGRKNPDANVPENLCWLTHREHFTAHWLLARMYGGAMSQAFVLMCRDTGKTNGRAYETHLLRVLHPSLIAVCVHFVCFDCFVYCVFRLFRLIYLVTAAVTLKLKSHTYT